MSDWLIYGVPIIALAGAIAGNIVLYASSRAYDKRWQRPHAGE